MLLSGCSVMGDEQPLVGDQQRRRELAAQTWWSMGWSAVGLDRGDDQMRSPDGRMLLCNGLGPRAASGTQRVLNRAHLTYFHTPLPSQHFSFLTPVPAACYSCTRVPPLAILFARVWRAMEREISPRMRGVPRAPPSACRIGI